MAEETVQPMLEEQVDGSNPVPIILGVVGTIVVLFFAGGWLTPANGQQRSNG